MKEGLKIHTPDEIGDTGSKLYVRHGAAWWPIPCADDPWNIAPMGVYIPVEAILCEDHKPFNKTNLRDGTVVKLTAEIVTHQL